MQGGAQLPHRSTTSCRAALTIAAEDVREGLVALLVDQDRAAAVPGADEGAAQQRRGDAASIDGIVRTALENALNANRTAGDAIANRVDPGGARAQRVARRRRSRCSARAPSPTA